MCELRPKSAFVFLNLENCLYRGEPMYLWMKAVYCVQSKRSLIPSFISNTFSLWWSEMTWRIKSLLCARIDTEQSVQANNSFPSFMLRFFRNQFMNLGSFSHKSLNLFSHVFFSFVNLLALVLSGSCSLRYLVLGFSFAFYLKSANFVHAQTNQIKYTLLQYKQCDTTNNMAK